jgi:putative transposase
LSVGVGLGVVRELMELEVIEVVGLRGEDNPDRTAKRHGREDGSMTLGGRRVAVRGPRLRAADDEHELPAQTYEFFADRDPLTRAVMARRRLDPQVRRGGRARRGRDRRRLVGDLEVDDLGAVRRAHHDGALGS